MPFVLFSFPYYDNGSGFKRRSVAGHFIAEEEDNESQKERSLSGGCRISERKKERGEKGQEQDLCELKRLDFTRPACSLPDQMKSAFFVSCG